MTQKQYVLVTPARNEESCIQETIETILGQTVLPRKWIIVSDGSIDRTDEIVTSFTRKHSFIQLLKIVERGHKDFGSKVRAFRKGHGQLVDTQYEFMGNLDADVTLGGSYYQEILQRFEANPKLGLAAGGVFERIGDRYVSQRGSLNSAAGSVQLFRRQCYESIGGYIPIKTGGIDAAAEIMARMHGWTVQTFPELHVYHHRRMTTGSRTVLNTRFRSGATSYALGYHPLFQLATCVRRSFERPYLLGSISSLLGYGCSWLRKSERVMPDEVVRFLRSEQLARIVPSLLGGKGSEALN